MVGCIIYGTVLNFLWSSMQKGETILFMEKYAQKWDAIFMEEYTKKCNEIFFDVTICQIYCIFLPSNTQMMWFHFLLERFEEIM